LDREALEISRRVLGETDRYTFRFRFNLAVRSWERGRYEEAEAEFRRTLEWGKRRYGSSSMWVLIASQNLGFLCHEQGRYDEAVAYLRETVEGSLRSLGQDAPDTLDRKRILAVSLSRNGDYPEAESLFREVLDAARRDGEPKLEARSHLGLAELECLRGNTSGARSHFEQALGPLTESGESYDYLELATYYVLAGDHDSAIRALRTSVEKGKSRFQIASSVDFVPLHGDRDFEALVADSDG
jgi:tetratricopeptide (TPR) repeat protein